MIIASNLAIFQSNLQFLLWFLFFRFYTLKYKVFYISNKIILKKIAINFLHILTASKK